MESRRTQSRKEIYDKIDDEREHQDSKWGFQDHDNLMWASILGEEIGEVHKAIVTENEGDLEHEIIQVIAVGVVWLEWIKSRRNK